LRNSRVEAAHATEARGESDFGHGQAGFVDRLFGKVQTAGVGHGGWSCTEMFEEQSAEMARTHAEARGKSFNSAILEPAFAKEAQRARNRV
jgi:hypothetical protein